MQQIQLSVNKTKFIAPLIRIKCSSNRRTGIVNCRNKLSCGYAIYYHWLDYFIT